MRRSPPRANEWENECTVSRVVSPLLFRKREIARGAQAKAIVQMSGTRIIERDAIEAARREPPRNDFDPALLSPHVRSTLTAERRSVSQTASPPLAGTHRCCNNDPNNLPEVNKTRCVAIAVMVFGVISCLGFLVPGLWWGGLGGILAVVGSSVILCCSGSGATSSASSHMAAGALTAAAAIVHGVAVIVYIMFWANTVKAVGDDCDDGVYTGDGPNNGNLDCDALEGVASAFIGLLIWPVIIVDLVTFIQRACLAFITWTSLSALFTPSKRRTRSSARPSPLREPIRPPRACLSQRQARRRQPDDQERRRNREKPYIAAKSFCELAHARVISWRACLARMIASPCRARRAGGLCALYHRVRGARGVCVHSVSVSRVQSLYPGNIDFFLTNRYMAKHF